MAQDTLIRGPQVCLSRPATLTELWAWALWDWASSPFFAVVITFVFGAYYIQSVAPNSVIGTAQWGWAMTISALVIAVLSPIFGAIADAGGPRKPWIIALTVVSAAATAALWWAVPDPTMAIYMLGVVLLANVTLEIANAFYNAMLPDLAPPRLIGRWSGWGWGMGYIGGIVLLLILLYGVILPTPPPFGLDPEKSADVRVAGPILAIWILLFSLPFFFMTPDRPSRRGVTGNVVATGLANLRSTFGNLYRAPNTLRFLIARLIYNDGLNTLFAFGGLYAAGTFGMDTAEVIQFGIALNVTSGIGAFGFAYLDDRIGSKPTILISIVGLFLSGLVALLTHDKTVFWFVALALGIFIGPAQSASRSFMARLSPPHLRAEMFGIYALTGKVTAFIGPFLFGTMTFLFGTQRAGMAVILVMFVIGAGILWTVREPRGDAPETLT